jgi:tRNA threonylcarbamoyladenosine biosynthesis protein TsaE
MEIIIKDKRQLAKCAREFLNLTSGKRIFAFSGSMGAGKTTIIKSICKELGAKDVVTSPTFTLINEYKTFSGESIYHIDFYRIKRPEEVFDFGLEEYLSSGFYCFM